ncbi:MAG: hypothetical protein E6Q25_01105 [Acinetobacter sp.]|nr:MAG: hypothetical protein E6Q25_01105 [Acinetobacter sp.]
MSDIQSDVNMSKEKTRPWVVVFLVLVLIVFIVVGAMAIYRDINSILGYLFVGLGLGGLIAGWGAWREFSSKKD